MTGAETENPKPKAAKVTPKKAAKKAAPAKKVAAPKKEAPAKKKQSPIGSGLTDAWKKILAALGKVDSMTTEELAKVCERYEAAPYWRRHVRNGLIQVVERGVFKLTAQGRKIVEG
jgi:hypothetical protein